MNWQAFHVPRFLAGGLSAISNSISLQSPVFLIGAKHISTLEQRFNFILCTTMPSRGWFQRRERVVSCREGDGLEVGATCAFQQMAAATLPSAS